ncbi:helix-turn-helix domain-containing protein [Brevibacterium sp.]|uniref:AraC-like ligand-binding domain-containing protein n=1 Tax=Brevibacterium sp. TaxID=1701 RepID=UPI0026474E42|nr:helix-turn-helix domain-containing protein [Brevibacterium sp.]MDN6605774.1 helix-turn-helix domain-containing protein [Brevibacterium sp.]
MLLENTVSDFDGWQALVSDSFVPLDTEPQRRGGFRGAISARDYDSVVMSHISANPHAVLRTPSLISADTMKSADSAVAQAMNYYKVSLQLKGHGLLVQDGREVSLAPGSLAIYDTSRPYTLSFDCDFSSYVMMFPQSRVNLPTDTVRQLTATSIGADHQLGAVATGVITQAGAMLPTLSRSVGIRLAGNVVDLLTTVMADELDEADEAPGERLRLWSQVTAYIDANLADPQLSPSTIAAAHFMSVRALHQIFEGSGETVSGEIRRRRVAGCRQDLADPRQAQVPVAAIGARWGLGDPAHFSRLFRGVVGSPPAQFRRSALGCLGSALTRLSADWTPRFAIRRCLR